MDLIKYKTLIKIGIEGTFYSIIKAIYGKLHASIMLNKENLQVFNKI